MKRSMKRLLCLVLALCLVGQFVPMPARATLASAQVDRLELEQFEEVLVVNPLYADVITEADLNRSSDREYSVNAVAESEYLTDFDEAVAVLREGLVARQPEIVIYYSMEEYYSTIFNEMFAAAREHTGNPKEGDALNWGWGGMSYDFGDYSYTDVWYLTMIFTPTYYTTAEQEAELDVAVDELLATVDRTASDYEQIKTIYDYICTNVTYDYDNLNNKDYKLKYTAYAAMINGTAVCQGYALLLYRLALELGIDARLIPGDSNGDGEQDHGWNIVCIDGKYYNADSTWDAGRSSYSWFLRTQENFVRHTRTAEYDTEQFHAAYPMGQTDYDPNAVPEEPDDVAKGTCGDQLVWSLSKDGVLTISGEGDMIYYEDAFDGQPWQEYEDSITCIRVEGTVRSIGSFAFYGMKNQQVVIGDGVASIGKYAFSGSAVTEVLIPDSVTTIGEWAFSYCTDLTSVEIGAGVTDIGAQAFYSCGCLKEIRVDEDNACYSSDSRGVLLDKAQTSLICAPGAISGDYSIPEGVVTIEVGAFSECDRMTSLVIPDSMTTIGDWAFTGCANMVRMDMGNGVVTIGDSAFRDCISLTELVIPDSVTTIGEETFSGCNSIVRLEIGSGVTRIDSWAMEACPSLKEIFFRGAAPSFGKGVFSKVTAEAYYPANNPTWTDDKLQDYGGTITWVPYGAAAIASGWSGYTQWVLTDDGVMTFSGTGNMKNYGYGGGQPWLDYADQITSVVIGDGVDAIGNGAFMNLTALESVTLPETGLTRIGEAAFYGCTSLKEIHIPDSIYTVVDYTFKNCTSLENVRLSKELIKVGQGAFENCTSLDYIYIPGETEIIGAWSFKGCTALAEADMQWADATEIREGAFKNCSALTEIILPTNIQVLGDSCFYGIGATSFTVPATVTKVDAWCFARAYSLKTITFEGDAPTIGEGAFNKITLTAYHPADNATWTISVMKNYGGTVTWIAK